MQKFTAIVADDDRNVADVIAKRIQELCEEIAVKAVCYSAQDVIEKVLKLQPDILFLDIVMPGKTGLEIAELIKQSAKPCAVVLISGHREFEYAQQAFRLNVLDYVVKPANEDKLKPVVENAHQYLKDKRAAEANRKMPEVQYCFRKPSGGYTFRFASEIIYITADLNYAEICMKDGTMQKVIESLLSIQKRLEDPVFFRPGREHIFNTAYIQDINESKSLCSFTTGLNVFPLLLKKEEMKVLVKHMKKQRQELSV